MDYFQALVLAAIQGLTEFLPVSSSAHLILVPTFLGWDDQGLAFDVAVHVGTLLAVLIYFKRDLLKIVGSWFGGWSVLRWDQQGLLGVVDHSCDDSRRTCGVIGRRLDRT